MVNLHELNPFRVHNRVLRLWENIQDKHECSSLQLTLHEEGKP